jgi:hypothetical protein
VRTADRSGNVGRHSVGVIRRERSRGPRSGAVIMAPVADPTYPPDRTLRATVRKQLGVQARAKATQGDPSDT